jgi:heat shock protein HspQ
MKTVNQLRYAFAFPMDLKNQLADAEMIKLEIAQELKEYNKGTFYHEIKEETSTPIVEPLSDITDPAEDKECLSCQ